MSSAEEKKRKHDATLEKEENDKEEEELDDEDDDDDEGEEFVVPYPAPSGYQYTGMPNREEDDEDYYISGVRQMLQEGGDKDWSEGKEYPDGMILANYSPQDVLQMHYRMYEKLPPLHAESAMEVADKLIVDMNRIQRRMICKPLYKIVVAIVKNCKAKRYEAAWNLVEGLLYANSEGHTNNVSNWTYADSHEGPISCDIAALMVVAIAHVCFNIMPLPLLPEPETPEGQCFDTTLDHLRDLSCPGDEPELYEKFMPRLEALARKRAKTSKIVLIAGGSSDDDDDNKAELACSLQDLTDALDAFESQYPKFVK